MDNKDVKRSSLILLLSVCVVAAVVAFMFLQGDKGNKKAADISPMSSLEEVRSLSEGEKDACLSDVQEARDKVAVDDSFINDNPEWSSFEMKAGEGIMDIPAGTNYEVTVNSYDGSTANGTVSYDSDYGMYNYTIEKLSGAGEWEFVSMVACQR